MNRVVHTVNAGTVEHKDEPNLCVQWMNVTDFPHVNMTIGNNDNIRQTCWCAQFSWITLQVHSAQSINHSLQSINQSINQSITHSAQSITRHQSLCTINQSINHSVPSINQSINHSAQSINQINSINQSTCSFFRVASVAAVTARTTMVSQEHLDTRYKITLG